MPQNASQSGGSLRPPRPGGVEACPTKAETKHKRHTGDTKSTKRESFVPFVAPFCAFCVPSPIVFRNVTEGMLSGLLFWIEKACSNQTGRFLSSMFFTRPQLPDL